jgi:hypothetical protein
MDWSGRFLPAGREIFYLKLEGVALKNRRLLVQALLCGFALVAFCGSAALAQETAQLTQNAADTLVDAPTAPQAAGSPQTSANTATQPFDDTSDSKWHIYSVGYLYLPGVHGELGVLGYNTGFKASVGDLLSNFRFGIMGAFVPAYNRWSIPTDFLWLRLKDDRTLAFNSAYSIQAKATESIFTPKVAYLVVRSPKAKVYGTAGLRYWHLGTTLNLQPPLPNGSGVHQSANWADFVAGARFNFPLSEKVSIDILGDAGAGGASLDYQAASFLNYQWKPKIVLQGGWRYMTVHYQGNDQFLFNMTMNGAIFGATYRFR